MNTFMKYRGSILNSMGILLLAITLLGSSSPVMAARSGSDVSITIVADKRSVKDGQDITYTATMTNHGPDGAFFVDTGFILPDQLRFVSETCDLGISPDSPNCEYSSLKAGETVVSKLVATPNPAARNHKRNVRVTARVLFETTDTVDPNLRNNVDSVLTRLIEKH
jgi:uncharacterized repeat protein (TIGR01451 family)